MSKVLFNLKNAHYAVMTNGNVANDGTATYGEMKPFKGAVSIGLDPQGSVDPFYADGIQYYTSSQNNGYQGDFVCAKIPEDFAKEVLPNILDANGVLVEDANAEPVHFAFAFQFDGDEKGRYHIFYNCIAQRPAVEGQTDEDSKNIQTPTLTLTAATIYNASLEKNIVKASTDDSTPTTVINDWFNQVYVPAAVVSA